MPTPGQPQAPAITLTMLVRQFWADIFGKEVQSAATYSYLWMADQMGHVCIGLVLDFALTLLAGVVIEWLGGPARQVVEWPSQGFGVVVTTAVVCYWEWRAFQASVAGATGRFPLDRDTLRRNAIVAAGYMAIGGVVGLAFHLDAWPAIGVTLAMVVAAILLAPPWLRQKIIWQKASLPYLFRLADAKTTIAVADAQALQAWIDAGAPPGATPGQVVIAGPIGSGRTSLATGIGTEFAFKANAARYLSFDKLLEFSVTTRREGSVVTYADDPGPRNIGYWPWAQAQALIIDDIGPVVGSQHGSGSLTAFKQLLDRELSHIQPELTLRHTVWVIGDLDGLEAESVPEQNLQDYAQVIGAFCGGKSAPLVIRLAPDTSRAGG